MLSLENVTLPKRRFGPLNLRLEPGELTLLCGPSGAGKSTLCELICGQSEAAGGRLETRGANIGYVAQDFENQLLGATVGQELEIGRRGGQAREALTSRHRRLLERFEPVLDVDPHQLSAGEQQLLLVTSLLLSTATVLILDESLSLLDTLTLESVLAELRNLCCGDVTVLLVSHDLRVLPSVDRVVGLLGGEVALDRAAHQFTWGDLERIQLWSGSLCTLVKEQQQPVLGSPLALPAEEKSRVLGEQGRSLDGTEAPLAEGSELALVEGDLVALTGPGGSGKSRVLGSLFGLESTKGWPRLEKTRALLRQKAQSSLWRSTVEEELEVSLAHRQAWSDELGVEAHFEDVPREWWSRSPHHLSNGQTRFLATTCLLLQAPRVLLLDEPFAGLDRELRARLYRRLYQYLRCGGCCLFTTHHADEVLLYAKRLVLLEPPARVSWSGPAREFAWSVMRPVFGLPLVMDERFVRQSPAAAEGTVDGVG